MAWALIALVTLWTLTGAAQTNLKRAGTPNQRQESFTRPNIGRPIKPEVPSQDRYVTNRVFLERADSLYHDAGVSQAQIVSGNVLFRQGNTFLYCDSAYYFSSTNSLNAFGHVKITRGDTLFVYADRLFYDGMQKLARLGNGKSQPQVKVVNRKTTLTADSLYYSMSMDRGWYDCGGRLEDDLNILTSQYGEYSPATKRAEFFRNVHLQGKGKRRGNQLFTDTLYYNTSTHVADIVSRTRIYSPNDTIITFGGFYNTATGNATLNTRSIITHRDSAGNVTTLEGDSIVYDKLSRISRAYMFRSPFRNPTPMVINDTARKVRLIGMFGEYDDVNRSAYATGNPLLVEYSRPDTNFIRADVIRTNVITRYVTDPYTPEQLALLDSLRRLQVKLDAEADSLEALARVDSTLAGQLPGRRDLIAEEPALRRDSALKDFNHAVAIGHARFFNQQMQAIADTMVYHEEDSLLHLRRKPIMWSEERQIIGDTIIAHFNDSTVDRARVVNGLAAEHVEEDFYNQLKGKTMRAFFNNKKLERLEVDDNVEAIMLPQEKDSTYNKLVRTESEHLTADFTDEKLDRLKMWPAVDGTVTPLFKLGGTKQYLEGFVWQEAIRPKREWYNGRWVWDDDLGDISDELELYFRQ